MFDILLIDLDDTVLDFHKQEAVAIQKALLGAGIDPTEEVCRLYSEINDAHWKRLEKGELTRQQVLLGRFETLFDVLGVTGDAQKTAESYMEHLSCGHYFLPGAREALECLHKKFRLFLVSNGTARVQNRRLQSAGIAPLFESIFISQDIGVNKPNKGYFDYCFSHISDFDKKRAIIVGDSLSSDILGGQNAGIATCWVNPKGSLCTLPVPPDFTIQSLARLPALLEK